MSSRGRPGEHLKAYLERSRTLAPLAGRLNRAVKGRRFPGSRAYWERRYASGGTSGAGSEGAEASFKADFLNDFVARERIASVVEFGCGDGRQLARSRYPCYVGLDVARGAIERCIARFSCDATKSFFLYDPECFVDRTGIFTADLALSLDVVFHLVEDRRFALHMHHLFNSGRRFVAIHSSDFDGPGLGPHVRHRDVSAWVAVNRGDFERTAVVESPHRLQDDGTPVLAKLLVFARRAVD